MITFIKPHLLYTFPKEEQWVNVSKNVFFPPVTGTYQAQRNKVVHLARVQKVQDFNLVQNHGSSWDAGRTTKVPKRILWVKEEAGELSLLHGQKAYFQSSQRHICRREKDL